MTTLLIFLAVLSLLVLIHELGHFAAARFLGIKVEEVAFGLPLTAPLLKFRKGETQYALYPVLFGGFVRLYGEENPPSSGSAGLRNGKRDFWSRGRKQRMIVVVAGVMMNLLLAVVGFVVLYALVGVPVKTVNKVTVLRLESDSPAKTAGLREFERIVAVEGKPLSGGSEFGRLMRSWAPLAVNLTVEAGRTTALFEGLVEERVDQRVVTVVPRTIPPEGQGPIGVAIADYPYIESAKCQVQSASCLGGAMIAGVRATGVWVVKVVEGLRGIGKNLAQGQAPAGVAGPIGIYRLTEVVALGGLLPMVELTAILSVNLAVFNVLPIPALDGGRMFFLWLEWARKKRLSSEVEKKINSLGMAFLISLLLLISLQDVIGLGLGT